MDSATLSSVQGPDSSHNQPITAVQHPASVDFGILLRSALLKENFSRLRSLVKILSTPHGPVVPPDIEFSHLAKSWKEREEALNTLDSEQNSLESLVAQGFHVIHDTGRTRLFVDSDDRVVMALVPFPRNLIDQGFNEAVCSAMRSARDSLREKGQSENTLILHDEETPGSGNLVNDIVGILHANPAITCLVQWQAECYKRWMPRLFHALCEHQSKTDAPSPPSIFGHTGYDIGLGYATAGNAVTTAGNFNFRSGGHLVLKEEKLVVEFPPCATLITPSPFGSRAIVPVSSPISEERVSLFQSLLPTTGIIHDSVNSSIVSPSTQTGLEDYYNTAKDLTQVPSILRS